MMSITTFVLHDQPQGYMFSYFYKLLRALSLSRILIKFSLESVYSTMVGKKFQIYGVNIPRKCIESRHFYPCPNQSRGKLLILPLQHFFKDLFPPTAQWVEETMICFIKIQPENMILTWNITLFIFCMICNFFKCNEFIVS